MPTSSAKKAHSAMSLIASLLRAIGDGVGAMRTVTVVSRECGRWEDLSAPRPPQRTQSLRRSCGVCTWTTGDAPSAALRFSWYANIFASGELFFVGGVRSVARTSERRRQYSSSWVRSRLDELACFVAEHIAAVMNMAFMVHLRAQSVL